MSVLRQQFRSAGRAYRAARYPGDLAAEVLPAPSPARPRPNPWQLYGAPAALAAAAVVVLGLFLSAPQTPQTPGVAAVPTGGREFVGILPLRPAVPVPTIHVPSFPQRVPEPLPQEIDVDVYRMRYDDLAQQVPQFAPSIRHLTVPKLSDLPDKGLDWLQKVWAAEESA